MHCDSASLVIFSALSCSKAKKIAEALSLKKLAKEDAGGWNVGIPMTHAVRSPPPPL